MRPLSFWDRRARPAFSFSSLAGADIERDAATPDRVPACSPHPRHASHLQARPPTSRRRPHPLAGRVVALGCTTQGRCDDHRARVDRQLAEAEASYGPQDDRRLEGRRGDWAWFLGSVPTPPPLTGAQERVCELEGMR